MFVYEQKTGRFYDPTGKLLATGYSGRGAAKNDPSREKERGIGPIPRGKWRIGLPYNSQKVGPFALPLTPVDHKAHGRTAFLIHGDSIKNPGTASSGCIILPRAVRNTIHASKVKDLIVK